MRKPTNHMLDKIFDNMQSQHAVQPHFILLGLEPLMKSLHSMLSMRTDITGLQPPAHGGGGCSRTCTLVHHSHLLMPHCCPGMYCCACAAHETKQPAVTAKDIRRSLNPHKTSAAIRTTPIHAEAGTSPSYPQQWLPDALVKCTKARRPTH
jgi:hypothetical protein